MKSFAKFLIWTGLLVFFIAACAGAKSQISDREYVLTTEIKDGSLIFLGVSDEINGVANPTLRANPGETITIILINGGMGQHDVTIPGLKAGTETVRKKGEETSVTFVVPDKDEALTYYDSVANHAKLGMKGVILVGNAEATIVSSAPSAGDPQVITAFQKGTCGSCHVIPGIPNAAGAIGPDLTHINLTAEEHFMNGGYRGEATTPEEYIRESIMDPNLFVAPQCPTGACAPNLMPATLKDTLTSGEIDLIITYLHKLPEGAYTDSTASAPETAKPAGLYDNELAVQAIQKGGCVACHVIPGMPGAMGTIGPDLSEIGRLAQERIDNGEYTGIAKTVEDYIVESIQSPDVFLAPTCPTGPCARGVMPASLARLLNADELKSVAGFLAAPPDEVPAVAAETEPVAAGEAPSLTTEESEWAKQVFFQRCAGCHGTLRKGATGPALTPDKTLPKGTIGLAAIIFNGTTRGMPDWGKQGVLTQGETETMAKFLQNEPPAPPELSLQEMKDSWKLITPVDQRPTSPQTKRNIENYFIVTLRDAGQVAIIDGDTYDIVNTVNSGYAVHITRMSASGRYAYVIGRDGRLALIDLWMEKPEVVARVQTCYDARSVEVSKYEGPEGDFRDKYAITGCYWPPHFAILDGQTLEPIKVVSSRSYTFDSGEYHPEPRVASILASHYAPEWVVNVKETGQIWIVNYLDPINPDIKMINAALFLHDGGLDSTHRYFLVAANQSNKIAVVDLKEGSLAGLVDVGQVPHPGRGANWIDPQFGPVWTTPHLGEASIVSVGTDPEGNAVNAWKNVRTTELPGSGSLFIKTHPNSKWVWVDMTLNPDPVLARTICVIAKSDPSKTHKCWEVGTYGRAVHFEYNKEGTEVWVSLWGDAAKPGESGEIVIYDDATLEEKTRIENLITPTGKFNLYNTVNDIY